MAKLTLNQAAKEAHKSKAALLAAIRTGRLSATKNESGNWEIEPVELFRCYPQKTAQGNQDKPGTNETGMADINSLVNQIRTDHYREREHLLDEIRDLRQRLDRSEAAQERLMQLLTHQTDTGVINKIFSKWGK